MSFRVPLLLAAAMLMGGCGRAAFNRAGSSENRRGRQDLQRVLFDVPWRRSLNSGLTFDLRRLKAGDRPRFENSVLNGKNQMPPWRGVLNEDQLDKLWNYIRANAFEK